MSEENEYFNSFSIHLQSLLAALIAEIIGIAFVTDVINKLFSHIT